MSYINDIAAQRELLEKNLVKLNGLISQKLGVKVHFKIKEKKDYRGKTYYKLYDDTNLRDLCGVAKYMFEKIIIDTWGIYWNDDDVVIAFHYSYTHPRGGSNGSELCDVLIKNNEITIIR